MGCCDGLCDRDFGGVNVADVDDEEWKFAANILDLGGGELDLC